MLGEDLERNIRDAWLRVRKEILSDPQELQRRLARRRMKVLTGAPRAWCVVIRASDRRITPAHWVVSPEHAMDLDHPEHPYEPIAHEVVIGTHAIRRYCHPVSFSREDAEDVAGMLGVSHGTLSYARKQGKFSEVYLRGLGGKPGKPVALLENREILDPGAMMYERPHEIWGGAWEWLARTVPEGFEQAVMRRPVFARMSGRRDCESEAEWQEMQWKDEMRFWGWRWVCPQCKKEVRKIYYPVAVRTLFDSWFVDPVIQKGLCDADLVEGRPAVFACADCHGVYHFCPIHKGAWNRVIGYLTGGMLYGHEVEKPASFVAERKRTRRRVMSCEAPVRRKVFTRLRLGWSDFKIARDLGLSMGGVRGHVTNICREERVANRRELAEKLKFAVRPPLNQMERAKERREAVKEMMLRDCSQKEIIDRLSMDRAVLGSDVRAIYRMHGMVGSARGKRRKLAEKLGVEFVGRNVAEGKSPHLA